MLGRFLLAALEDHLGYVSYFVRLRPVDFGLPFRFVAVAGGRAAAPADVRAHAFRFVRLDRTGVCLLFGHADCGQSLKDFPALNLQLAR